MLSIASGHTAGYLLNEVGRGARTITSMRPPRVSLPACGGAPVHDRPDVADVLGGPRRRRHPLDQDRPATQVRDCVQHAARLVVQALWEPARLVDDGQRVVTEGLDVGYRATEQLRTDEAHAGMVPPGYDTCHRSVP